MTDIITIVQDTIYHPRNNPTLRVIVQEITLSAITLRRLDNAYTFDVKPVELKAQWVIDEDQTVD